MSDSSDEEYGPITASWGTQVPVEEPAKSEGWDSLIDPNVKVGPNDVGSGNLHRRGTNYKPINEEIILARRKNIQVPKEKMLEAIRETELSLGLPESKEKPRKGKPKKKPTGKPKKKPTGKPAPAKCSNTRPYTPTTNYVSAPPPPSTTRPPPPPSTNGSSWSNTNLVDTPFWEKKSNTPPTIQAYNKLNSKPAVDNTDWAAAVKDVVPNPDGLNDSSPAGWVIADKSNKASNAEKTKPAAKVTWTSNKDEDISANNNRGTVKAQDRPENKWGHAKAGDPGKDERQPSWGSSQTQALTTSNQGADSAKSIGNDWQAAANNWITPTPTEAPTITSNNNDWISASKESNWETTTNNKWTASSTTTTTTTKAPTNPTDAWGAYFNRQQNGDWTSPNANKASNWGSNRTATTTTTNTYPNDHHIPSDKPSWLNSIPDRLSESQSSRFSNPRKQRYSEVPIDIPEPVNYRRDGRITPLKTALPPPPENSLLITIKVELSESIKVMVDIRELDDPYKLAVDFGAKNNVNSPKVIEALTKLFAAQKELGLKKKNQRLRRRVQPKNYDNVYSN
ncbi:protein transport protein gos1 [Mucor velutinosus]|uniref:Protein transport protein gos1 n=1 Tax=Mucor velutinosus TaxID=708070 RepID=A0AAN7DS22_9FUNG|nr:protein transport protein gos1 [Mucor velutinosus]